MVNLSALTKTQSLKISSISTLFNLYHLVVNVALFYTITKLKLDAHFSVNEQIIFAYIIFSTAQFCVSLMMISTIGFYILLNFNEFITRIIEDKSSCSNAQILKLSATIYNKICDAYEDISKFYSIFCMLLVLMSTFFNVFNFYTFYVLLKVGGYKLMFFAATSFLWAICYLPPIVCIIAYSNGLQKQSVVTGNLITKLMSCKGSNKDVKQSKLFELLVAHRRPKISCGMFDLDWKFCFSVIGCVFSFSIIVIQFSDV
jgi:7tm Chemosensory receptor